VDKADPNIPLLEMAAVDVVSAWHSRVTVAGVDWKVQPGEFWVVGGRHASGKTDLLMTAAGLRLPAAGSVRIFGRNIAELSETEMLRQRARVGFVFKGGGRMFADLTVAENVALAICYHRDCALEAAWEEVQATLELTELTPLAYKPALNLSIDWQQRVGLARALALKPEVLFLDEPAAGLDAQHRDWWRTFLESSAVNEPRPGKRPMTIVASTNDFARWPGGNHRYAVVKAQRLRILELREQEPVLD
jgi:ABC-type transporter Mla maintaining outer membrane lipid asymmetry ATPase subunit MlaF